MKKDFHIDTHIYSPTSIMGAIDDFGDDFNISFEQNTLSITADNDAEISEIFGELMNYVLTL